MAADLTMSLMVNIFTEMIPWILCRIGNAIAWILSRTGIAVMWIFSLGRINWWPRLQKGEPALAILCGLLFCVAAAVLIRYGWPSS